MTIYKNGVGPIKKFTGGTLGPWRDSLSGTPTTLPIAKPATPQVSITIQSSDMPTFTGVQPISYNALAQVLVSGQNTTASAINLNFEVYKNGVSIGTTSKTGVTASNFWGAQFNVVCQPGDQIDVYVWASVASGVNWDYWGLIVIPSSIQMVKSGSLMKEIVISTNRGFTNPPSLGTNATFGLANWFFPVGAQGVPIAISLAVANNATLYDVVSQSPNYLGYSFGVNGADTAFAGSVGVNATKRSFAAYSWITSFQCREVRM